MPLEYCIRWEHLIRDRKLNQSQTYASVHDSHSDLENPSTKSLKTRKKLFSE